MSLASWPAPASPMCRMLFAMREKYGFTASSVSLLPPHIAVSVPSCARASMPETGASIKAMPRFARESAISSVAE
ncbi:hypothetical protein D3C83_120480 [compost metagenome]